MRKPSSYFCTKPEREGGGAALLTIVMLVSLVGFIGYTTNRFGGMSAVIEDAYQQNEVAYYVAEAGIYHAIWEIKKDPNWVAGFTDKPFGSGSYTVTAVKNLDNSTTLTSTGTSGAAKETLRERYKPPCSFTTIFSANKDSYIELAAPTNNNNDRTRIQVDGSKEDRGLFSFDLSTIPTTAVVSSADLDLYLYETNDSDSVAIFRVTAQWIDSEVTWEKRVAGVNWGLPGGDFNPTIEGTLPASDPTGWKQVDLTSLVQNWVDGTYANFGILLKDNTDRDRFYSSEEPGTTFDPKLTVSYSTC